MKTNYILKNACIVACLALGLSSVQLNAADRVNVNGVAYKVIDFKGTPAAEVVALTIAAEDGDAGFPAPRYEGNITIPAEVAINGTTYPVKRIGNNSMRTAPGLTGITLPEGLVEIGDGAFADDQALTAVVVPSTVTVIEDWAFNGNGKLAEINFPEGITKIGHHAFQRTALTAVTLPSTLTKLDYCIFQDASDLASINLEHVKEIGAWALYGTSIPEVNVSDVPVIGQEAFRNCPMLKTVVLNNIFTIATDAFRDCTALETAELNNVISVGTWSFTDCTALSSVTVTGMETLEQGAFSGCTSLTSLVIPNTTLLIDAWSLEKSGIKEVFVSWSNPELEVFIDEWAFGADEGKIELTWKVPENLQNVYGSTWLGYPVEYYDPTVGIEDTTSESIAAFYTNGALNLNNLNGYHATIVSLDGSTVAGFRINGEAVEVPVTLNKGIYLLNATSGSNRTAVKFIVR